MSLSSLNIYMSALGAYLRELERAEATAGDADQQQPHGSLTVIDPSPVLQSLTCQVSHRPTHSFHAERGEDPKGIPRSVPLLSLPRDSGTEPAVLGRPLTTLGGFNLYALLPVLQGLFSPFSFIIKLLFVA